MEINQQEKQILNKAADLLEEFIEDEEQQIEMLRETAAQSGLMKYARTVDEVETALDNHKSILAQMQKLLA